VLRDNWGASSPQPSVSVDVGAAGLDREAKREPPVRVGMKTGLVAAGGGGARESEVEGPPPYLAPDALDTFSMMLSGLRWLSERAVISTW
jgi:hypothetical protein